MDEVKNIVDTTQFIVIKIGNEQFGIDIKFIDNIVRMQSITRVPKVPEYFKGVINLRGEVIPVMSLRLKMGLELDEYTKTTRIIIIKLEQHEGIGVIVDEVKEVVTLETEQIEKLSYDKDEKQTFVYGVGKVDNSLISLLDLNAVLAEPQA
ncbi:MAG: chemotaxis protein CheW [Lachnospiraceae bacterium]|nr:chemotaxis protein CheW [Lachnospiraceae bacterium]